MKLRRTARTALSPQRAFPLTSAEPARTKRRPGITMGEFEYIDWLRQRTPPNPLVPVGPGDDCAVLKPAGGAEMLVTTDMLLDGTHFHLTQAGPRAVGRKAMAVNLSDIAAMAGKPV